MPGLHVRDIFFHFLVSFCAQSCVVASGQFAFIVSSLARYRVTLVKMEDR